MIGISLCSCTLVKFDREGDGWNVWDAVALLSRSLRGCGCDGIEHSIGGYVGFKLWTWWSC